MTLLGITATTGALVSCASEPFSPGLMDEAGTARCAPSGAMTPAPDGCNSCICTANGDWACTDVRCDKSDAGKESSAPTPCTYAGTVHQAGDTFASADGCNACTCTQTGEVMCTQLACASADASSDAARDSRDEAGDSGAEACCPSDWSMHGCLYSDGGSGFACHNPAMGCASSSVCGQGCDKVVSGRCGGVSLPDAGCTGPRLTSPCGFCTCSGNAWVCSGSQCPPPVTEAGTRDAAIASCGAVTCGAGEWCDTTLASPICRCGQTGNGCASGMQCCVNPVSGCGAAHCNESCKPTCQN